MKSTWILAVAALLSLPGCKKSLEPKERDEWLRYTAAVCDCANVSEHDEAVRCVHQAGVFPQEQGEYDEAADRFFSRTYKLAQDCISFAERQRTIAPSPVHADAGAGAPLTVRRLTANAHRSAGRKP